MKGLPGLVIALVLGCIGAGVNWYYLHEKGKIKDKIEFIVIKPEERVKKGEAIKSKHLSTIAVPRNSVGDLQSTAFLAQYQHSVLNEKPIRDLPGGEIILRQDLATPQLRLRTEPNVVGVFVPIGRQVVSALITPGETQVQFILPPEKGSGDTSPQLVGPFEVLAVGNRLSSIDVLNRGTSHSQEDVLTIKATYSDKKLDVKTMQILNYLRTTNNKPVGVLIVPPNEEKEA